MKARPLALVGLLQESILPGEERELGPPALSAAAAKGLAKEKRCVAIAIASSAELPSFVAGRWATECAVLAAGERVTLRGDKRVRVVSATGPEGECRAEVTAVIDASPTTAALARAAHSLAAAVDAGALPLAVKSAPDVASSLAALARALAGSGDPLRDLATQPLVAAVAKLVETVSARAPAEHAACELEAIVKKAARGDVTKEQRARLHAQVVEIQRRLDVYDPHSDEATDDATRLQRRLAQTGMPKAAAEVAKRELKLLRSTRGDHHDYSHFVAHLDLMARLPWHAEPLPPIDLDAVGRALDREHAGLEAPKRRILEYLAVRGLGGSGGSMILCLVGPPGVGKTTLARAMAGALGRKFVRVSLGGVHDECEIRGFRKSFTAASSGRIVNAVAVAGSASCVMLLDEIDKLGTDRSRSPAGALHEVLDPEQNTHFSDNFLEVPYDLSRVLFVCTANDSSLLPPTLLNRLEVIELDGYTVEEKIGIARKHLVPKVARENALDEAFDAPAETLNALIAGYTRESGVRQVTRELGALCRRRALTLFRAVGTEDEAVAREQARRPLGKDELTDVLGAPRHADDERPDALPIGVAAGLSVGAHGGGILYIEVGAMPGTGKLKMTGRLGEVMRESAHAALTHLRIDPERYGATREALARDFHVHVPEGAVAKEGPSAGLALFYAFLSAARAAPLRQGLALTGELTLTGRVLGVGGVKSKLLAAERAGMTRIILPYACRHDTPKGLHAELVYVGTAIEALDAAFGVS